jgi:hypothetical protein
LQKVLNILAEGMRFLALNVDGPDNILPLSIKHRNNDLGASGAKRSQVTGIGRDVSNIDDLPLRHGRTGESFGKRESGMFRLAGPAPGDVPHNSSRGINVIKTNPAVVGRASYDGGGLLKCSFPIPSRYNDVFEIRYKLVAFSAHRSTIANLELSLDSAATTRQTVRAF